MSNIFVQIVAEVLTLQRSLQRVSTARHDFDLVMAPSLAANEAIFVLFCTTEDFATANTLGFQFQLKFPIDYLIYNLTIINYYIKTGYFSLGFRMDAACGIRCCILVPRKI